MTSILEKFMNEKTATASTELRRLQREMEATELTLSQLGFRELAKQIYGLRLDLSEDLRAFELTSGVLTQGMSEGKR